MSFIGYTWCVHTYNCKEKKKEMIIIKSLGMDYYTKVSLDDHRKNSIGIIERHACAPEAAVTVPDFSDLNWPTFVKWQIGLTHLNDFFVLERNGTTI